MPPHAVTQLYQPITRAAFDANASRIPRGQRNAAYTWIWERELTGHRFVSAASAVHAWTVQRLRWSGPSV